MGRFDGVLLASDFDNTLIYTEEALMRGEPIPPLPERNRQALEHFMAEGGRFAVSTGRALAAFEKYAALVPMNAPGVICNGAAIYDFAKGEYLVTRPAGRAGPGAGPAGAGPFPQAAVEAYHIDNVIHAVHPNEITRHHEHLTKVARDGGALPAGRAPAPGEAPLRGVPRDAAGDPGLSADQGWGGDYELIFSGQSLLEMTAKGANKGGMVRRLAELLGIRREHVYCVGDEANDLPMLRWAAEGFAPANCIPAVRESGATIVSHARDGALADVVEILEKKYR